MTLLPLNAFVNEIIDTNIDVMETPGDSLNKINPEVIGGRFKSEVIRPRPSGDSPHRDLF